MQNYSFVVLKLSSYLLLGKACGKAIVMNCKDIECASGSGILLIEWHFTIYLKKSLWTRLHRPQF